MRVVDAAAIEAVGYAAAIDAITAALRNGLDASVDPPRTAVPLEHGQFLLMPSSTDAAAGVKIVSVAPGNAERGLPRIHGVYVLFDATTLRPTAVLDGAALTTLRTPAMSVAAVLGRLPDRPLDLVLIGSGPQALGHAAAFAAVRPGGRTTYLVRDPARAAVPALALQSDAAAERLAEADVVVCATTSRTPVFDSALVRPDAVVIAVGSHEPDARELDAALLGRATVLVEDVATALREAGDVVLAIDDGALRADDLVALPLADTAPRDRPLVFKSVGMAWQDLVVAQAVVGALS